MQVWRQQDLFKRRVLSLGGFCMVLCVNAPQTLLYALLYVCGKVLQLQNPHSVQAIVWCSCSIVSVFITPPVGEQPTLTNRFYPAEIENYILAVALSKEITSNFPRLLIGKAESRYRFGTGGLAQCQGGICRCRCSRCIHVQSAYLRHATMQRKNRKVHYWGTMASLTHMKDGHFPLWLLHEPCPTSRPKVDGVLANFQLS